MVEPWLEFSRRSSGPAVGEGSRWDWPISAALLRAALLANNLTLAQVRLWPGRRRWWDGEPLPPLAHVAPLLPDSQERLVHREGYPESLPVELRLWSVPAAAVERASAVLEHVVLPEVTEWLLRQAGDAEPRFVTGVTVRLEGRTVRLIEG